MSLVWQTSQRRFEHLDTTPVVMGILNVTPDSFSDGGELMGKREVISRARKMVEQGAMILDVGGESTRPGAAEVCVEEEVRRVIPALEWLRDEGLGVALSVDTRKPEVAELALAAGAEIVNDVTGLVDVRMQEICANAGCGVVVMHAQGTPQTMQISPEYCDVVEEVANFFVSQSARLEACGISRERQCFDPGIGFGKTLAHNLSLMKHLTRLGPLGRPMMLGISRKSLIAQVLGDDDFSRRLAPMIAMTALGYPRNAAIHRVHDVEAAVDALRMAAAIAAAE